MKKYFLLISLFILCSCGEENFKKYVALEELRILGLVAEDNVNVPGDGTRYAEVLPGTTVTITPWVSDVNETTGLQFEWQACVDAGLNYGVEPSCADNPTATAVTTGTVTTLNTAATFSGAADSFTVTPPATMLTGRSASEQYNGINYLIIYSIINSRGQKVTALKRLQVSGASKAVKNKNPVISQLTANGLTLGTLSTASTYVLGIAFSATSKETFQRLFADGRSVSETEELQTTWFYSDGETKYFRTINEDTNSYKTPSVFPTSRASFIVVVSRDNRGGLAVQKVVTHP